MSAVDQLDCRTNSQSELLGIVFYQDNSTTTESSEAVPNDEFEIVAK